ncbi:MAG: hypothetical protein AUH71_03795 [Thaumarchaeota archaeon 13_1_40CM_4_48_7]|nr:MAG: hypothetical protein AUH71_03795 [Thaumarchaeota archaeon 13_1_40CM_4_48_7]
MTFLGYLYYVAGIIAILSGIDGILDIVVFFSPSLYDIFGSSVLIEIENVSPMERLISDTNLVAEFILGPFYLIVGHGLLGLRPRAIELKLVIAIIGLTVSVIAEIALVTIHPDELFGAIISVAIEMTIDLVIIVFLHKPSIKKYFESHSPTMV